jgi:hypothetical protein
VREVRGTSYTFVSAPDCGFGLAPEVWHTQALFRIAARLLICIGVSNLIDLSGP